MLTPKQDECISIRDLGRELGMTYGSLMRLVAQMGINHHKQPLSAGSRKVAWVTSRCGADQIRDAVKSRPSPNELIRVTDLASELKLSRVGLGSFIKRVGLEVHHVPDPRSHNVPAMMVSKHVANQIRDERRRIASSELAYADLDFIPVRDLSKELGFTQEVMLDFIRKIGVSLSKKPLPDARNRDGWVVNKCDVDCIRKKRLTQNRSRRWNVHRRPESKVSLTSVDVNSPPPDGMVVRWRAYKVELKPNNKQRTILAKHAGCARKAWNWALQRKMEVYKATGKNLGWFDLGREWTTAKKEQFPYTNEVSADATRIPMRNLEAAFLSFFKGKTRFPKRKTRRRGRGSFCITGNSLAAQSRRIYFPKIGWVRLKQHGYIPTTAKIIRAIVTERANRWFVSVHMAELRAISPPPPEPPIGIDLGLLTFAVTSDGEYIKSPKPMAKSLNKMRRVCRQVKRRSPDSQNRRKALRKFARLHYRIACQRNEFIHQLTSRLAKTKRLIAIEDLNVHGLMMGRNARGIQDAGWGMFRRYLAYKCEWHGSKLHAVDRFFASTKTCLKCGKKKEMPLDVRVYNCDDPTCGFEMERDLKSAKSVLNHALEEIRSLRPNFMPAEDGAWAPPMKQELTSIRNGAWVSGQKK